MPIRNLTVGTFDLPIHLSLSSFRSCPLTNIINNELPSVDWLVKGLFAVQDRVLRQGEFGSFKSWLLLDMALHIAAGRPTPAWHFRDSPPSLRALRGRRNEPTDAATPD